jgi:hypothetical protein
MNLKAVAVVVSVLAAASSARAEQIPLETLVNHNLLVLRLANLNTLNVINWKVGDTANYNISAGSYGQVGTMTESVTKDEGTSLWIEEKAPCRGRTIRSTSNSTRPTVKSSK